KDSNQIDSDEYKTKVERIEVLKNEIKAQSEFNNAEFELFNVNGFSNSRETVPGTSSLDYKFVVKVDTSDIGKWTKEMMKLKSTTENINWTEEITEKRKDEWSTKSHPEFYSRENNNVTMIVYRTEGIIFKRVITE